MRPQPRVAATEPRSDVEGRASARPYEPFAPSQFTVAAIHSGAGPACLMIFIEVAPPVELFTVPDTVVASLKFPWNVHLTVGVGCAALESCGNVNASDTPPLLTVPVSGLGSRESGPTVVTVPVTREPTCDALNWMAGPAGIAEVQTPTKRMRGEVAV